MIAVSKGQTKSSAMRATARFHCPSNQPNQPEEANKIDKLYVVRVRDAQYTTVRLNQSIAANDPIITNASRGPEDIDRDDAAPGKEPPPVGVDVAVAPPRVAVPPLTVAVPETPVPETPVPELLPEPGSFDTNK
jgi:hypothetical protein